MNEIVNLQESRKMISLINRSINITHIKKLSEKLSQKFHENLTILRGNVFVRRTKLTGDVQKCLQSKTTVNLKEQT